MNISSEKISDREKTGLAAEANAVENSAQLPQQYNADNSIYCNELDTTEEDSRDIKKAQKNTVSPADRRILTVLSLLNVAVIAFMGIYFAFTNADDEFANIKRQNMVAPEVHEQVQEMLTVYSDDLVPKYPRCSYPKGILPGLKPLYSVNNDTAAWIRIKDTNVDHVVLQTDNNTDYDRTTFYGDYYIGGSLFMDYRNRLGNTTRGLSKNTIIYGHYLENQRGMFTDLNLYEDVEYYREHPVIELSTLYGNYQFKIFAAMIVADAEGKDNSLFYYWDNSFSDENTIGFANECARRSFVINPSVDILPTDKFLTLSTCSHTCDIDGRVNARFVIVARLVREGESLDVKVEDAYTNTNPRMPQLWYDLRGLDNPFKNVPIWQYD